MLVNLFAIKDVKARTFSAPFAQVNTEVALRAVKNIKTSDPNHVWNSSPEDFELWQIALFDDKTGEILDCESTKSIEPMFVKCMGEI